MSKDIIVPAAGESVTEADIVEWKKESGDYVEMDEALVSKIFMLAPPLTIISSSFAVYNLYKKYKNKEISKKQFIFLSSKITGIKAAKIITLMALLTVPVVGQVLGVYLISQLMLSAIGVFEVTKEKLLLPAPIKWLKHSL